jgi:hypothetical protein
MMVSDSPMSMAYYNKNDETFCVIQDFASSGQQHVIGEEVCELLALRLVLQTFNRRFPAYPANIAFWPTSSHTFFGLVSRGSRLPYLQDIVYEIKLLERQFALQV